MYIIHLCEHEKINKSPLFVTWYICAHFQSFGGHPAEREKQRQSENEGLQLKRGIPVIPLSTKTASIIQTLSSLSLPSPFSDPNSCTRQLIFTAAEQSYGWPKLNVLLLLLHRKVYLPLKCHAYKAENKFERRPSGQRLLPSWRAKYRDFPVWACEDVLRWSVCGVRLFYLVCLS